MFTLPHEPDPRSGLPIGPLVVPSSPAAAPEPRVLQGRWCRLEPLDADRHGDDLFAASTPPDGAARFQYMATDAPADRAAFDAWLAGAAGASDRLYHAVVDPRTGRAEGRQALLRIDPTNRAIEIGDIYWGPAIARSAVTTEALFLVASHVFDDLGYRRFEWKCNALNEPSRRAAERFGFTFEGLFRRAMIVRGRSRDTAWYSIIDEEWPQVKAAYAAWLAPSNFDADGRQRTPLAARR